MKITLSTLSTTLLFAASILSFSSCQEYSPFSVEEMKKGEYAKNFFREYGEFPKDMNWDLSAKARTSKIDPSVFDVGSQTRVINCPVATNLDGVAEKLNTYYEVQPATLNWLRNNLAEGRNNTTKGNAFRLTKQTNKSFAIIPIYQGTASMVWDLHLVSGGHDYKIWEKNQGLELKHTYSAENVDMTSGDETAQRNRIVAALCSGYWSIPSDNGSITCGPTPENPAGWYSSNETSNPKAGTGLFDSKITFREADSKYKYYPSNQGIYLQKSVSVNGWTSPNEGADDYVGSVVGEKESAWGLEKKDGKWYLNLGSAPYFPYIAHNTMWNTPEYEIYSMKKNELVLRAEFDQDPGAENPDHIVWQFTLKHDDEFAELGNDYKVNTMDGNDRVQAKPIVISGIEGEFYMYLHITNGDTERGYAPDGTQQRSDAGMMLAMTCDAPTNLNTSAAAGVFGESFKNETISRVMVIGCEDSHMWGSDWDLNDVVFLMVGLPELPHKKELIGKRYMMEDLGNTLDFDFNDIVVDVSEIVEYEENAQGNWVEVPGQNIVQVANIRYKCGTLPFQVGFSPTSNTNIDANKNFPMIQGEINVVPAVIEGETQMTSKPGEKFWDENANNIFVNVSQRGGVTSGPGGEGVFTIAFPNYSDEQPITPHNAPLIIAVPQSVVWMNEGVHIPSEWWNEGDFSNDYLDIIWRPEVNYFANSTSTKTYSTSGINISVDGHDTNTVIDPVTDGAYTGESISVGYRSLNGWDHCVITLNNSASIAAGKYDFKFKINSLHDLNEVSVKFNGGVEPRFYEKVKAGKTTTLKTTVDLPAAANLKIEMFFHKDENGAGNITVSDIFFQPHVDK